jgi:NAD(P)-dependent dehydrogenase (short-subunit alcohol dehydrogenase family)
MDYFNLHNKTILVTGASSGIGRQVAIHADVMGATIVLCGRDMSRLEETRSLLKSSRQHLILRADLTLENDLTELVKAVPGLDGIVHCAGVVSPFPVKFLTREKLQETFRINYDAVVELMAQITRGKKLNKNASVVFLSSISANHPHKGGAAYAGSKAALESFSKVIALEFFTQGIRSNCIAAAMVRTPMYEHAEKGASKETLDEHVNKYPLGVGKPEDVANAAVFLLSEASRWITGTTLTLDGGFLLGGL